MCDGNQYLPLSEDHTLGASGFVPHYRSPEESLHTSPEPPLTGVRGLEGVTPTWGCQPVKVPW